MTNQQSLNAALSSAAPTLDALPRLELATTKTELLERIAFDLSVIDAALQAELAARHGNIDMGGLGT